MAAAMALLLARQAKIGYADAMTGPDKKLSERKTLDAALAAAGLRPDQEPEAGEAPDFMVMLSGGEVGVEITTYQSGATVEDGSGRREAEGEWDRLKRASDKLRRERLELRDISVGLMFKGRLPPARLHPTFLEEIAAFALARAHQLTSSSTTYWPSSFSTHLMRGYLRNLILRRNPHAEWYSDLSAGWVPFPDFNIADVVANKSRTQFRPAEELWLVIECGLHISETMLNLFGVEDFERVPSFERYQFERVIVLAYDGAYQWDRREGWRRLTGKDREDRGPTLDELKAALTDPGWLEDTDGKAREVAAKTLRDLRGGGE